MTTLPTSRHTDLDALQARVAYRITADLTATAAALPQDITERLRVGRELALSKARLTQRAAATSVVSAKGGTLTLGGHTPLWLRVASWAPLVVLVAGLVLIQQWHEQNQIAAAAEVDAALLADDLPPAAYSDPGFAEFLKQRNR